MKTSFASLFVLLASAASLNIAYGQFAGIPECAETCIEASTCTDLSCLCAEQSALITCVYRTCPVEDRAGSQYIIRQECEDVPPPSASASASSPASASSGASSAAAPSSTSSGAAPEETTIDSSPAEAPATGTPTTAPTTNQPAASATNAPTRNLASSVRSSSSASGFGRSSSASRASTVVVVQTIGANEDETGLLGAASSVKAGIMGYVAAVVMMGAGVFLV